MKNKTTWVKKPRNTLLCMIHTHPKYTILKSNDAWEDWLLVRYGANSCRDISDEGLIDVLGIFNGSIADRDYIKRFDQESMSSAQEKKIETLTAQLNFSPKAYFAFIKRQLGDYKIPHTLSKKEATTIITGLQKIAGER